MISRVTVAVSSARRALLGLLLVAVQATLLLACAPVETARVNPALVEQAGIVNLRTTGEAVFASGQPTAEQLQTLATAGIKHVINLRPSSEQEWDEAKAVRALGMHYHSIAVAGPAGVTFENAAALDKLLHSLQGEPLLLHCSSGNRVGALIALAAQQHHGADLEAAIAEGQRWGLTRLEPLVRAKLAQ